METVKIVEILPTKIWQEKDMMGTVHIKMQHDGMPAFTIVNINYDYAYTSNSHQHQLAQEIMKLLGATPEETP